MQEEEQNRRRFATPLSLSLGAAGDDVTGMMAKSVARTVVLVAGAIFLADACKARDVTELEKDEIRNAVRYLVGPDDKILKVDAHWGEIEGVQELEALITTRPVEVGEGLCVTEGFRLQKKDGERNFKLVNIGAPISQYWEKNGVCDDVQADSINEFGVVPNSVMVSGRIATTHVARIIRSAAEILRLATPDVRCNEPRMAMLFQPGVLLRLTHIGLDSRNVPGAGIRYIADYTRQSGRNGDGLSVQFAMFPDHFEVNFACNWAA